MPNQPQLNPDALEKAYDAARSHEPSYRARLITVEELSERFIRAYLTVAQPVVTGEQVNLAGWTCNGIHEPGDYSTCEECRDACDDLAQFYNHMMRNPRPFKHWTGQSVVSSVEELVTTRVGLALANAAFKEGLSAGIRACNESLEGEPFVKPVSPYSAPLLAMIKADRPAVSDA